MNHDHCHCDHELKHCEHCDVVYCRKCKREWGEKKTEYVPYYPYPYTPYIPYWSVIPPFEVTTKTITSNSEGWTITYSPQTVGCNHN